MLISFSVSNYRSIKNKATLSFIPVKAFKELPNNVFKVNSKINLLRSAVIYGANASGKSNILKAFNDLSAFVTNSTDLKLKQEIELYDPFLLDTTSGRKPTAFEVEFLDSDKLQYSYLIEFDSNSIIKEELLCYPKGQKVNIFTRIKNKPISFGTYLKGEKKSIEARLLTNQLFLSKGANENIEKLVPVYNFFMNNQNDFYLFRQYAPERIISNVIAKLINEKGKEFITKMIDIISALDTGILSFELKEQKIPVLQDVNIMLDDLNLSDFLEKELTHNIITKHNVFDNSNKISSIHNFDITRESSGTRSLFAMVVFILDALETGKLFYIDEFEQNLHPLLARALIDMFHNPKTNKKNAQLLFTTHEISLLDKELFRRDQLWFTEKDEYGKTELYSMGDIEGARNNVPYDKWYLSGRFGATPVVNDIKLMYGNDTQKKK